TADDLAVELVARKVLDVGAALPGQAVVEEQSVGGWWRGGGGARQRRRQRPRAQCRGRDGGHGPSMSHTGPFSTWRAPTHAVGVTTWARAPPVGAPSRTGHDRPSCRRGLLAPPASSGAGAGACPVSARVNRHLSV